MRSTMTPFNNLDYIPAEVHQKENSTKELDTQVHKLMLQIIPPAKDWTKLSGGNDENLYDFLDYIDGIITSINPPSQIITC